jgi:flagellar biosynthesis protein FlhG
MPLEDQASRLRDLVRQARDTRTIAVVSGKGGVGKTNIALNLSILLSAAGNRVALVDADLALANIDVLLNISVRANLSHVIAGTRTLDQILVDLPCGVQLVPGASGLAGVADLTEFQRARLMSDLIDLEADNDVIVVDCGAGIGPDVLYFAAASDNLLVVTTPEPTAVTDSYAVVKVLAGRKYAGHMSLLVNMASSRTEARVTQQRIADVARRFLDTTVYDAGYMLTDAKVGEAVHRREPFVLAFPRCSASRSLAALTAKLSAGGALAGSPEGFFRRVAKWFA